ncbi:TIGR03915 family putative DNA repair protein [Clostridium carnis]
MIVYIYNGSFEGLLTCIYDSFYSKTPPFSICTETEETYNLLNETVYVHNNIDKFKKVKRAIITKIDPLALTKVYTVYLSNHKNKGILIYNYLKLAFSRGSDIHKHLYIDVVKTVDLINRQVNLEAHRFTGFVRFKNISNKFLYSSIEPDNDILEIISPHFQRRFSNEYWIIHDIKRGLASVYNRISWEIIEIDNNLYNNTKNYNDDFEDLWREYFNSTTIKERINFKLQKRSMPKRYWKNLIETSN